MEPKTVEPHDVLILERKGDSPGAVATAASRPVPADISLRLLVNGSLLVTLLCLNQGCEELALGFLYTEGLIDSLAEVRGIRFHEDLYTVDVGLEHELDRERLEATRSMTSGCGRGVTYVDPRLDALFRPVGNSATLDVAALWGRLEVFNRMSELHREVGGVHSCLFEGSQGTVLAEDIGRHNCVDRIAGVLLRRQGQEPGFRGQGPGAGGQLITSGRVSTEILTKCVRIGVEVVVSRSAPTASALRLAEDFGLTVVGYARGGRALVYTGTARVRL
jgi:FdhD protein